VDEAWGEVLEWAKQVKKRDVENAYRDIVRQLKAKKAD
jgi:hypothetical protein